MGQAASTEWQIWEGYVWWQNQDLTMKAGLNSLIK